MKPIPIVLGILAVLSLAAGIIYFTVPAHSLPSIMGTVAHSNGHRDKRATAGIVLAVVLGALAWITSRSPSSAS